MPLSTHEGLVREYKHFRRMVRVTVSIGFGFLITAVIVIGIVLYVQSQELHDASCSGRTATYRLLVHAENAVKVNPTLTATQRQQYLRFYENELKDIKVSDCPIGDINQP